jgi:hypothetical protein
MLTVDDWQRGRFGIRRVTDEERADFPDEEEAWIGLLESGFDKAFDELGFPADMEEVIAYAFYFAGARALRKPCLNLVGFLERSDTVDMVTVGTDTCLWRKGEDPKEIITARCPLDHPRGDEDSLEAILNDLGLTLSPDEIEAYMRDELFRRGSDLNRVLDRCFQRRQLEFHDRSQQRAFQGFIRELWEHVQQAYNFFADQSGGRLRQKALQILDSHLMWLRSLELRGLDPDGLPVSSLFEIGQAVGRSASSWPPSTTSGTCPPTSSRRWRRRWICWRGRSGRRSRRSRRTWASPPPTGKSRTGCTRGRPPGGRSTRTPTTS